MCVGGGDRNNRERREGEGERKEKERKRERVGRVAKRKTRGEYKRERARA